MPLVAAVDVGTGSARAGVFDGAGRLLGRAEAPIETRRTGALLAEQSSDGIWAAVCAAMRAARAEAGVAAAAIGGLAFDATASLVARDASGGPVGVADGDPRWDTILWLDHRAHAETAEIAAAAGPERAARLAASPEMPLPKILWLKRRRPDAWARAAHLADLADHLAMRAAGTGARSRCTLVCKWGWSPRTGWPTALFAAVGLGDLPARAGLPDGGEPVGADLGPLTPAAAAALGLTPACRVAAGLVDAHAGALGALGGLPAQMLPSRLALVAGTSTCLMTFHPAAVAGPGVWGPYPDAILPGLAVAEAGQSASGALLDHLIRAWAGAEPDAAAHARVAARIAALRAAEPDLAPDLHVLPDFHGDRAPGGDPLARGAIVGLDLDASFDGLCRLYWRAATGLALGLADALAALTAGGPPPVALHAAGGHARSPLLTQLYADATGVPVVVPRAPDAVLLGTAMAAAVAAGLHPDLAAAARAMEQGGDPRHPDPAAAPRLARDRRVLAALRRQRGEIARLVAEAADAPVPLR